MLPRQTKRTDIEGLGTEGVDADEEVKAGVDIGEGEAGGEVGIVIGEENEITREKMK